MQFNYIILIISFLYASLAGISDIKASQLSGRVTDKITNVPIPGVTVYILDLKTGTTTDSAGYYMLENLPASAINVQVSFIGYKRITVRIDLRTNTTFDFKLEKAVTELHEFVVTGLAEGLDNNRNPAPVTVMHEKEFKQVPVQNIMQTLASKPGVEVVTTGPGIAKPVIRGLSYNRVIVIHDGMKQEGQQWGDEHGIEIDETAVNNVEIMKGPASLIYGSDALAGVINLMSAPALPLGKVNGSLSGSFNSNNGLYGYSVNVAGNQKNKIWSLRYSEKKAHAFKNKYDGFVYNSGYSQSELGGTIGANHKWGYSHLIFSAYELVPGLAEGERDSLTGKFTRERVLNDSTLITEIVPSSQLNDYNINVPYQTVNHYKVISDNNFIFNESSLKLNIGWQQNKRKEFEEIDDKNRYGLYFLLNSFNYSARYLFPQKNNIQLSAGINGMWQHSENRGDEFLVPEYRLFDVGVYFTARKSFNRFDISGGLRYDKRIQTVYELYLDDDGNITDANDSSGIQQFLGFKKNIGGFSGAVGIAYQFSEIMYGKLNVSSGYRAPNIAELGSNGEHEGTFRYEIGDQNLKPEHSTQFDLSVGINSGHITGELNVFTNSIDNFIFISALGSVSGGDSLTEGIPTFRYSAEKALLYGGELYLDIHPHPFDWIHFENTLSLVYGERPNAPENIKYLPYIPAPVLTSELKTEFNKPFKNVSELFIKGGIRYVFNQDRVYSYNDTESPTQSYMLANIGAGVDFNLIKNLQVSVYAGVENLFDTAYQNHLSRLKYAPENYQSGRKGIYDMGRNLNFKVIIKFNS